MDKRKISLICFYDGEIVDPFGGFKYSGKCKNKHVGRDISFKILTDMMYEVTACSRNEIILKLKYLYRISPPFVEIDIENDADVKEMFFGVSEDSQTIYVFITKSRRLVEMENDVNPMHAQNMFENRYGTS